MSRFASMSLAVIFVASSFGAGCADDPQEFATVVAPTHAWASYHWARTANPFTLKLGDNVSAAWEPYLATTSSDWSASSVLDTTVVAGQTKPANCRATAGRIEVCNKTYGNNGWLGIAQIWISGGEHIVQATTKLNDTYFNTATYNTEAWRNLVMCQEVGHGFGLDHQDETFNNANLGTCMDYTNDPTPNQHPNAHDYEQLELIYAHLDTTTTIAASTAAAAGDSPDAWGAAVGWTPGGRANLFARDVGGGVRIVTHVFWVP